ncbi:ABC transporter substrate-binding protein [Lysobacter korlensis]|uniref:ABC transporter substrate-binding protein n=1 Tax=Lysobacter korlensis TaxID=553636 RepID=A0ABV6RT24_9GAMM
MSVLKKRWLVPLAVSAAGAMALAGCSAGGGGGGGGGGGEGSEGPLKILSVWAPGTAEADIVDDAIAQYEDETGIDVELTTAGEETGAQYEVSVLGGDAPHVIVVNLVDKQATWLEQGIVEPVNEYLTSWGLEDKINPDAIEQWTNADGEIQGFPYSGFVWPVWYNLDLLAEAGIDGVPTTTDELIAAAPALREAGVAPVIVGGSDWSGNKLFLQIIQSYMEPTEAAEVFANGGYCDSDAAMQGIELLVELREAGVFADDVEGYTADQMNTAFFEGQAAIMPAGSWAFSETPEDLNVQLGGFPVPDDGAFDKPTAFQGWTSAGFFLSEDGAASEDLVKPFLDIMYSDEIVARMVDEAATPRPILTDEPVEPSNELLAFAMNDLSENVEFAAFPDALVPGALLEPLTRQSSLAFSTGDAASICASLDSVY